MVKESDTQDAEIMTDVALNRKKSTVRLNPSLRCNHVC